MNLFFLIAALLVLLLSFAHAFWGETRIFNVFTPDRVDAETHISLYVPWHQITYVLLASGIGLLLAAVSPDLRAVAAFIVAVIIGNFAVFVAILIVKKQTQMFAQTLPQTILFLLLIGLIVLGLLNPVVPPQPV